METLDIAATQVAARRSSSVDLGAVVAAPADEPFVGRWPGWARLAVLIGGSAALWAVIGWLALRVLRLG